MPKSRSLAEYKNSRRWTDADARVVLNALEESGLSTATFAVSEGFDAQRLYFGKRRLERADKDTPAPTFVEVRPNTAATLIEVVLRSGQILRVTESVDGAALRRLVDALERGGAC